MDMGRLIVASLVSMTAALAACSSSSTPATGGTSTPQDPGVTGDGVASAASAPDTNPDGVKYPTDNIGVTARANNRAGSRIANYKFLGYKDGNKAGGLVPVSLAQYYDPTGAKYKLIHIQASGSWCPHCEKEIEAATPVATQLDTRKVVWLVSLAEGPTPGTASDQTDLDNWVQKFKAPFPHVLDPGNKNLGPFYDAAALPWNANISAKSMEIITAGVGAVETSDGILAELDDSIAQLDASYGLK